jgi:amidophosphoribosyltransferase
MANPFGLSVDPAAFAGQFSFSETLLWGSFYGQHLGEECSGFAVKAGGKIWCQTAQGLIRPNFGQPGQIPHGTEGIGYCGNSKEPFKMLSRHGEAALCYSGNILNKEELLGRLLRSNRVFDGGDDIEIIANLLLNGDSWTDGLVAARTDIKGTFSVLVLTEDGIYAAVSPDSHWPLIIGKQKGAVAVACESTGFANLGFKIDRDLEPGEVVLLKNGDYTLCNHGNGAVAQACKFLWVYTAFPSATIWGLPVSLARKKLGAVLARKDIKRGFRPDVVSFVPDSGRYHGLGYFEEFCRAANAGEISEVPLLDMPLQKYPYAGRSYTPSSQEKRDREAHLKIVPNAERYDGKVLVILEDSVVRGTQVRGNLVPKLRSMGFAEIHVRASNPELLSYCPWGKSTRPGETLADKMPDLQERASYLGVDSVAYNSLDDLKEVFSSLGIPPDRLCVDCALRH